MAQFDITHRQFILSVYTLITILNIYMHVQLPRLEGCIKYVIRDEMGDLAMNKINISETS